jgi:sugar phosphate isomerase/epimerase
MPRYAEALRKRQTALLLLATAIVSPSTPHAEDILRTARKLGIKYYRLGQFYHQPGTSVDKQLNEIKAGFKDLAALNKELGLCAVFQNHSSAGSRTYVGGDLAELYALVKDFHPDQIGVAFDLGHALVVHGDEWSSHFEKLKSHVRVAYVKDAKRGARFTRFGEGEFSKTDWFKRLKQMGYSAPLSIHIEFDWTDKDKRKTRAALLAALRESVGVLKQWLAAA